MMNKLLKYKLADFSKQPKRILLVKTHAIGDTIMVTPAIAALRGKFPGAFIALLTGKQPAQIIEGNKDIDEIISFDESVIFSSNLWEILKLVKRIRKYRFDTAFVFHYSSLIHLLVLSFGIPLRIGYDKAGSGRTLTHKKSWDENDARWTAHIHLDLAKICGAVPVDDSLRIGITDNEIANAEEYLCRNNVKDKDILIGIFPAGGKNSRDTVYQKRWPIEKFAGVIDSLAPRYDAKIIIFGSADDRQAALKLSGLCRSKLLNACGKNLKESCALIKKCSLFITNDSAPLHMAIAMNTPTVSLFGPSRSSSIVKEHPGHITIQSTHHCSPCYCNSVFPGCETPKCMEAISVEQVVKASSHLLSNYCLKNQASLEIGNYR